jgi:HSP20 family protein
VFDRAWLEKALELQKTMKEMSDHSWHFDKSWLDKAMEMQKMIPGMGADPGWYKELLGGIMKGYPGSGMFNFQDSGESDAQQEAEAGCAPADTSGAHSPGAWQPQFTITETVGQVMLIAYIPGIRSKDDVAIKLHGDTLYVSGKNQSPSGWQGQDGGVQEFYRAIRLPADVRSDGTSAYYANGSLTVKIPKNRPVSVDLDFTQ